MMASLLEREGMRGNVHVVYMNLPYNIDFKSNMQGLMGELDVTIEIVSLLHKCFADRLDVFIGGSSFVKYNRDNGSYRITLD